MYENKRLPGVAVSKQFRNEGSIWQNYTQTTWFKVVQVNGTDRVAIKADTIMKKVSADGSYTPITAGNIVPASADLPGVRLSIVADKFAKIGIISTISNS